MSISVMSAFLISIENFYLVEKKKIVKKFVDSGIVKKCDELDLWPDAFIESISRISSMSTFFFRFASLWVIFAAIFPGSPPS